MHTIHIDFLLPPHLLPHPPGALVVVAHEAVRLGWRSMATGYSAEGGAVDGGCSGLGSII